MAQTEKSGSELKLSFQITYHTFPVQVSLMSVIFRFILGGGGGGGEGGGGIGAVFVKSS